MAARGGFTNTNLLQNHGGLASQGVSTIVWLLLGLALILIQPDAVTNSECLARCRTSPQFACPAQFKLVHVQVQVQAQVLTGRPTPEAFPDVQIISSIQV
ncbi:hypothetical protein H0G86_004398 [Trichoderma simmonsii]|uniref:Uncharacterized protein n=1 Tax=Trichoderma simmonsii TaxID=1491479 RepID=A0A8G0LCK8_9HYPO|nr:hypothetical protein H0G86_004398 [Trichoderma simmonsii]